MAAALRRWAFGGAVGDVRLGGEAGFEGIGEDAAGFAAARLGFEPDEMQRRVLGCGSKQVILNCSRQAGKSTVAAAKAVHHLMTRAQRRTASPHPPTHAFNNCDSAPPVRGRSLSEPVVVIAAPTEKQSAELLLKARRMLGELGVKARGDGVHRGGLRLPNGSRMIAVPGDEDTVRGISGVSLLIVDEASRVPDGLYRALRPMLAVADGDVWLLSTPNGKNGFFWEAWECGGEEWARFQARATECGRIGAEWLERERSAMGETMFRQEYMCEFTVGREELFEREMVVGMLDDGGLHEGVDVIMGRR